MSTYTATYSRGGGEIDPDAETYNCPAGVAVLDAVYLNGTDNVDKALASGAATMPVIGIVTTKRTATTCVVVSSDSVAGFVGLTPDVPYYASPGVAGGITATPPVTAGQVVQQAGFARSSTVLVVSLGTPTTL